MVNNLTMPVAEPKYQAVSGAVVRPCDPQKLYH
jgi:hypothetical protein